MLVSPRRLPRSVAFRPNINDYQDKFRCPSPLNARSIALLFAKGGVASIVPSAMLDPLGQAIAEHGQSVTRPSHVERSLYALNFGDQRVQPLEQNSARQTIVGVH
jgi:hypothetical protein